MDISTPESQVTLPPKRETYEHRLYNQQKEMEHHKQRHLFLVRQGHESIDTTLSSYGQLSLADQKKIIGDVKLHDH